MAFPQNNKARLVASQDLQVLSMHAWYVLSKNSMANNNISTYNLEKLTLFLGLAFPVTHRDEHS